MSILVVNVCKEKLHYYEFVKPIEYILKKNKLYFESLHYKKLTKRNLKRFDKMIICGTSLNDFDYLINLNKLEWIKDFEKPVLGICAGMQIIGILFGGNIKNKTEIGFYYEDFKKEFLGSEGKKEVYHLHNNFIDFKKLRDFDVFCEGNGVVQAVKHKFKEVYGVLFHPEVRNKELIKKFAAA
jgi:GMP synthase-like glutamine amidotransferase